VVRDLQRLGAVRISIRPNPLTAPMWADVQGAGITALPRYSHVLDLTGGLEAVEALRNKSTRRGLRKAEKEGVQVELDHTGALLPVHYQLYLTAVQHWSQRQREPLALAMWRAKRRDPLSKLQAMAKHLGRDFCQFVAYHEGRPVASSIMLIGPAAHDTRAAMDRELAAPVRANDLLQARSIEHALERGCSQYHLGESGANEQLAAFKERFGAVGHHYAEFRIERLPVTRVDSAARGTVKRLIGFKDA
jgi:lipid II:glycine glycyltransferase (peptidoglycan interpeptide bridge formation enzyme)